MHKFAHVPSNIKVNQNYGKIGCMARWQNLPNHKKLNINLTKSVNHENEVKVRWQMPGWHMINVWTKYGEPRLYENEETDLITKTRRKYNKVSRP